MISKYKTKMHTFPFNHLLPIMPVAFGLMRVCGHFTFDIKCAHTECNARPDKKRAFIQTVRRSYRQFICHAHTTPFTTNAWPSAQTQHHCLVLGSRSVDRVSSILPKHLSCPHPGPHQFTAHSRMLVGTCVCVCVNVCVYVWTTSPANLSK